MIEFAPTTDLCDANESLFESGELAVLPGHWLSFGQRLRFAGAVVTVRLFEDNSRIAELVRTPGEGRVIVADGGGSPRFGLVGGNLAKEAERNGWAGLVVEGAVRDRDELDGCAIGLRARFTSPRRSQKRGEGTVGGVITICGVTIRPNDWLYADRDGVIVSRRPLHG
jgi:regulator of ribonuclease activity A